MLKALTVVTTLLVGLALVAGPALASSCPKLIKEGREAAAKMDANDAKVKDASAKLDEAQKLHEAGKHAESMAKANEALAELGIKK